MKGDDIANRLLDFAVQVLSIISALPKTPVARHIAKQLTRSATAPGAHYDEARGAESRADFVHKVKIACKEMRESHYWLRLTQRARLLPQHDLSTPIDEARQLAAILTASATTASRNQTIQKNRKLGNSQCAAGAQRNKGKQGGEGQRKLCAQAAREMKEGPSKSASRSRLQTTPSCCGQKPWW